MADIIAFLEHLESSANGIPFTWARLYPPLTHSSRPWQPRLHVGFEEVSGLLICFQVGDVGNLSQSLFDGRGSKTSSGRSFFRSTFVPLTGALSSFPCCF